MSDMMPISLLVKPVGGDCNLRCTYCFYREHPSGRMDAKLFMRLLESYEALPFVGKSVILQGGEPLLAGPEILSVLNASKVEKSLQTNATLMTDELAHFLAANGWLVGASLDGRLSMTVPSIRREIIPQSDCLHIQGEPNSTLLAAEGRVWYNSRHEHHLPEHRTGRADNARWMHRPEMREANF